MKQSQLFTKTARDASKDEVAANAKLLTRGGFIYRQMSGVYTYLPLGFLVLKKIESIIREEMNAIGGQEMLMTTLQDPELWKRTGRWDDKAIDNWFKSELVSGSKVGIANTHEEPITEILTHFVDSYKDLPVSAYQFQTKFRNELRAKSGILRGREFIMKDMYSFSRSQEEFLEYYEAVAVAYEKIFDRVGIGEVTYRTKAAGGAFTGGLTDEFQTVCEAGEDTIYLDQSKKLAINKEVLNQENLEFLGMEKKNLKELKAIEVGNIFPLGTRYSKDLGLQYRDEKGGSQPVVMGSYGIGLGRLMGTVVEVSHDEDGIIWPEAISPFDLHLVSLLKGDQQKQAEKLHKTLQDKGYSVLYDDREVSAGIKFADSDLLGIPRRIVISEKTLKLDSVEIKIRAEKDSLIVKLAHLEKSLKK